MVMNVRTKIDKFKVCHAILSNELENMSRQLRTALNFHWTEKIRQPGSWVYTSDCYVTRGRQQMAHIYRARMTSHAERTFPRKLRSPYRKA